VAKSLPALINGAALIGFTALARRVTRSYLLALLIAVLFYLRMGSAVTLVRMYALLLLLIIAAMIGWDRWQRRGSGWAAVGFAGAMIGAVYTHAAAGLLLPAFVLAGWATPRRWSGVGLAAAVTLALVPWVWFELGEIRGRGVSANVAWIQRPVPALGSLPFELLSGEDPGGASPRRTIAGLAEPYRLRWLAALLHLGFAAGFIRLVRSQREALADHWRRFLPLAILVPPLVLFGISLAWKPVLSTRYVLISLPAYWLALGAILGKDARITTRALLAVTLVWLAAAAALSWKDLRPESAARRIANYVARERRPNDLLLLGNHMPLGYQTYWEWTWRLRNPGRLVALEPDGFVVPWVGKVLPHVTGADSVAQTTDRIWLVTAFEPRRSNLIRQLETLGFVSRPHGLETRSLGLFERDSTRKVSVAPDPVPDERQDSRLISHFPFPISHFPSLVQAIAVSQPASLVSARMVVALEASSAAVTATYKVSDGNPVELVLIHLPRQTIDSIERAEPARPAGGLTRITVPVDQGVARLRYWVSGNLSRIPLAVPSIPTTRGTRAVEIRVAGLSAQARLDDAFPRLRLDGGVALATLANVPSVLRLPTETRWSLLKVLDLFVIGLIVASSLFWYRRFRRLPASEAR
jgi:hypothetical protein